MHLSEVLLSSMAPRVPFCSPPSYGPLLHKVVWSSLCRQAGMFYLCDVEMKAVTPNLTACSHQVMSCAGDQEVGKNRGDSVCFRKKITPLMIDLRWAMASRVGRQGLRRPSHSTTLSKWIVCTSHCVRLPCANSPVLASIHSDDFCPRMCLHLFPQEQED